MRILLGIMLVALTMAIVSCGSSTPNPGNEANLPEARIEEKSLPLPSWYKSPPQDETYHYERSEATAKNMEDAEEMARLNAAGRIATWLRGRVEVKSTRTRQILGDNGDLHAAYDRVVEALSSEVITGLEPSPGHLDARVTKDNKYHVYILMRIPRDQSFAALDKTFSKEEELYEAFLKANLMEEFKADIADYKKELLGGK